MKALLEDVALGAVVAGTVLLAVMFLQGTGARFVYFAF